MRKRWPEALVALVVVAVMAPCFLSLGRRHHHGGLGRHDLGEGREVELWSQPQFGDPSSTWAEVRVNGQPLHKPVFMGHFRPDYQVRTFWLNGEAVSVTSAVGAAHRFAVYVDWTAAKVWRGNDEDVGSWRERYRQLRQQHPELPADPDFE